MTMIGVSGEADSLVLCSGREFKWAFENVDENGGSVNFPSGQLYFEFQTSPITKWSFTLSGSTATLTATYDQVAAIPKGTKWQLVWRDASISVPSTSTTSGDLIARGVVVVVG